MSELKRVKLEDVIHSANTGLDAIKRAPIVEQDTGIKCLRIQDISQEKKYPDWGYCEVSDKNYNRFSLKESDIIIARTGATVGVNRYIHKNLKAVYNNGLIRLRAKKDICLPKYLYYQLQSYEYWGHINGVALSTSTQPNMRINGLLSFKFDLPDIDEQNKIASILSAFDDLIENNTRRIAILEETARLIYREWFVHYRYPGHENDRLVDSGTELGEVPEGWEIKSFSDIADFQNGKAFKPKHWQDDGLPIVKIRELKNGFSDNTAYYHGNDIDEKYYINDGDLLFAWSASLGIFLWYRGEALLNQHIFNVSPKVGFLTKDYLYYALDVSLKEFLTKTAGTTMQHIRKSALDEVHVALPPEDVYKHFDTVIGPINRQILTLHKNIQRLKETRDLLLPKLISGKVEV